jgi:ATP synthase protein I
LSAGWLAAAVIAVTATWLVVQVVLSTRVRIPVYDLPADRPVPADRRSVPEPGAR